MRPPPARFPLAVPALALLVALALAAGSCRPGREVPEIHGRVSPRSPVTLPEGAVLEVQVADVTRADAAPVVVAKRTYERLGAAPWRFSLRADSLAALDPAHEYAVQARVLVDGKPRLVSKRRTLVDPAKLADTLDVVVEPVPRTVGVRRGRGPGMESPRTPCYIARAHFHTPPRPRGRTGHGSAARGRRLTGRPACPPCPAR